MYPGHLYYVLQGAQTVFKQKLSTLNLLVILDIYCFAVDPDDY